MNILLDSNILSRLAQSTSPHHPAARFSVDFLRKKGEQLCVVPQNLFEFWSVCTRPLGAPHNGLGLTIEEAKAELSRVHLLFTLLPDTPAVCTQWERLVVQYEVKGKSAHDARLVAAMNVHGVTNLLTFNTPDFSRYPGLELIDPTHTLRQNAPT